MAAPRLPVCSGSYILALSLVLGLAACADVGEYRRPDSLLPAAWQASTPETSATGPLATRIDWRQMFLDPRLQALIDLALENNRDLRISLARIAEVRALYQVSRADRLPTLNASLGQAVNHYPAWVTGGGTPLTTKRNDLNLTVVSYELDFWGRVANASEAAKANYLSTEASRRTLRITLITEIANTYFTLLELDERIAIARSEIETRQRSRDLTQRAMDLGAAARSDVLTADGLLSTSRAGLAILEGQRASFEHALHLLIGTVPKNLVEGRRLIDQDVRNDLAPGIPSEVLLERPDVIAAEYRLREAHANVKAARAAFLPRIMLTASLGLATRSLSSLFTSGATSAWSYQPAISMPLFDNGRTSGLSDVADARRNVVIADYEKIIQQAFREVADLLTTRSSLLNQRQAAEAALQAAKERLAVTEARYRSGSASYMEVLDVKREFFSTQQGVIQVRRAQLSTAAQLYKALGGGEATMPASEQKTG